MWTNGKFMRASISQAARRSHAAPDTYHEGSPMHRYAISGDLARPCPAAMSASLYYGPIISEAYSLSV